MDGVTRLLQMAVFLAVFLKYPIDKPIFHRPWGIGLNPLRGPFTS